MIQAIIEPDIIIDLSIKWPRFDTLIRASIYVEISRLILDSLSQLPALLLQAAQIRIDFVKAFLYFFV